MFEPIILVTFINSRHKPAEQGIILAIGILFLLIATAFTYKFTVGRGSEYGGGEIYFTPMMKRR
jgi:hypothetical protein